jgi:hypothetical protein
MAIETFLKPLTLLAGEQKSRLDRDKPIIKLSEIYR